jgi:hypothetical protein
MLRAARELLAVRSPLDAELIVSEMLGTWWGRRLPDADVEEVIGEGLVGYADSVGSPAALALLSGIASLGTTGQCAKAAEASERLVASGVARPAWAERVGKVKRGDAYVTQDVYGDRDEVVCGFSYDDEEPHALVAVIDYNLGGMVRDAWVTSQVETLLDRCRQAADDDPLVTFAPLPAARVRPLLEESLRLTDEAAIPAVTDNFGGYHAFLRSRVRSLPKGRRRRVPPPGGGGSYGPDDRAMLAAEFLASDEAEAVSDRSAAGRCVDHIIDYGCDQDFGRPLRVSPTKSETFLLDWLPRKVMLSPEEQDAMPHVLVAWVRWAAARTNLPEPGLRHTLDALWEAIPRFVAAYRDPASFGMDASVTERLLPDGDLEALARRAFAFPVLQGTHGDVDLAALDPADPVDRRTLVLMEHVQQDDAHVDGHLKLATLLWRGEPPELWETAQRLLDLGYTRQDVLHMLMDALARVGEHDAALKRALAALPED